MLLWNSFTPGRSERCSSQQLGRENTEYFTLLQNIKQMELFFFSLLIKIWYSEGDTELTKSGIRMIELAVGWWLTLACRREKSIQRHPDWLFEPQLSSKNLIRPWIHPFFLKFIPPSSIYTCPETCASNSRLRLRITWTCFPVYPGAEKRVVNRDVYTHLSVSDLLAEIKGPRDNVCRTREIPTRANPGSWKVPLGFINTCVNSIDTWYTRLCLQCCVLESINVLARNGNKGYEEEEEEELLYTVRLKLTTDLW